MPVTSENKLFPIICRKFKYEIRYQRVKIARLGHILFSFHVLFKDKSLLRKWIAATKREHFQPTFNSYLCGEHFLPSDFNFSKDKDKPHLLPNAVPSFFTFPEKVIKKTSTRKAPSERRSQETDESPVLKKSKASPPLVHSTNTHHPEKSSLEGE